jgi:hypothetical protein
VRHARGNHPVLQRVRLDRPSDRPDEREGGSDDCGDREAHASSLAPSLTTKRRRDTVDGALTSASAARCEVVAGGRATDRSPNQTTGPERQWRKHVLALVAADLSLAGWSIVRRLLRETPYPCRHSIPPESHPTPASFALAQRLGRAVSSSARSYLSGPALPSHKRFRPRGS